VFSSGLSVNEFALLRVLGPEPLAQVMGASVVQAGWQYLPPLDPGLAGSVTVPFTGTATLRQNRWGNAFGETSGYQVRSYLWSSAVVCELDTITDAWNLARRRALHRLTEEAIEVGADAVVGVRLERADHDLGRRTVEYAVNGTAVHTPGAQRDGQPVLTGVSVQDYFKLVEAGHEPVTLVAASVAVFASPSRHMRIQRAKTTRRAQERTELSQGFQLARSLVRESLRSQVTRAGATGVVGVEISESVHREKLALASALGAPDRRGWNRGRLGVPYYVRGKLDAERHGWVITMHGAGTAIRPGLRASGPAPTRTEMQLRLGR
jgi:uncharacterized protein YbjQ (UPF0145 family)